MNSRTIGIIDGLLFLAVWSGIAVLISSPVWGALPIIIFIVVPIASLVSWRGSKSSTLLLRKKSGLLLFVKDGFKWGCVSGAFFMLLIIANEVGAAGGHFSGTNIVSFEFAKYLIFYTLPVILAFGISGAIHAAIFFYINKWLASLGGSSCS